MNKKQKQLHNLFSMKAYLLTYLLTYLHQISTKTKVPLRL